MPFAVGDQRLRVVGVADEGPGRVEIGAAVGLPAGVRAAALLRWSDLGSPAKRADSTPGAAEGVDAQPGIVGQAGRPGGAGGVAGLGDGVFDEAGMRAPRLRSR